MVTIHRFSKTQINTYEDCAYRWMWRYLEGRKTKPSGALKLGGSIHETTAHNFIQKADTQTDLPTDEMTDFFADNLKANIENDPEGVLFDPGESAATIQDQGVGMVRAHHSTLAPKIQPKSKAAVEQKIWQLIVVDKTQAPHLFTLAGPDWRSSRTQAEQTVAKLEADGHELELAYQLDSIVDLIDSNEIVRELKTRSKAPIQHDADMLIDLSQYSLAYRMANHKPETALAMDVIVKNAVPKAMTLTTRRSREQLRFHLDRIAMMARAIEAHAFVPHTNWYGCSQRFCGYWDICAGKGFAQTVDLKPALEKSIEQVKERRQGAEGQEKESGQENRQATTQAGQENKKGRKKGPPNRESSTDAD